MKRVISVLQSTNVQLLLVCVFLTFLLAGCTPAQNVDLSTKKAVLEQLGKQKNEKFSQDKVCIERLKESAKVIVIGFFRYDYGCHLDGAFVNSVYIERDESLSKKALNALGWKKANLERREQLAKLWAEKGLLAFATVLNKKDKDLDTDEFHPPQVVSTESGETIVTLWILFVRMRKEFQLVELRFAKDGNLLGNTTLKNFAPVRR